MSENIFSVTSHNKRIWSFVIDDMIINLLLIIIFYEPIKALMGNVTVIDETTVMMINQFVMDNAIIVFMVKVLYHTLLVWQSGMTLGKYVMKIRVVDYKTGSSPLFWQAFLRASIRLVSEMFFYLGFLFAFFSSLRQTLHDKLSNCVVVDA
ncbi:MAG: RDD family protein [Sulfurovum sp.]|nr:RDD family protein [Sulfurovum sp.]MCB4745551.1 RDD family protein [Sulfurovum sp.]MCB4749827.1 RDD family protein [Sulfurovum sp.]MCB4750639.1 RDD family protein [Sulfurovum sp.]MCB4752068.1 RDD family protein [Sulfurovum sp.]